MVSASYDLKDVSLTEHFCMNTCIAIITYSPHDHASICLSASSRYLTLPHQPRPLKHRHRKLSANCIDTGLEPCKCRQSLAILQR